MRKSSKSGGMPRRETAADSLRDRKSSSFDLERIEGREKIPVDYLSRDQLCPRNDVIGTIMLKKEVVSAVSNFRPADIDEDRRRNSQFSPYTMLVIERAVIGGEEA